MVEYTKDVGDRVLRILQASDQVEEENDRNYGARRIPLGLRARSYHAGRERP